VWFTIKFLCRFDQLRNDDNLLITLIILDDSSTNCVQFKIILTKKYNLISIGWITRQAQRLHYQLAYKSDTLVLMLITRLHTATKFLVVTHCNGWQHKIRATYWPYYFHTIRIYNFMLLSVSNICIIDEEMKPSQTRLCSSSCRNVSTSLHSKRGFY
jgi:hypothetical protein